MPSKKKTEVAYVGFESLTRHLEGSTANHPVVERAEIKVKATLVIKKTVLSIGCFVVG